MAWPMLSGLFELTLLPIKFLVLRWIGPSGCGITHGLLNQAYFYGVPAMGYYNGPGGGAGLLAATLKQNFDLDVDNYVVVNMYTFVKFVDALGGIDVNLPQPVDGTPNLPF